MQIHTLSSDSQASGLLFFHIAQYHLLNMWLLEETAHHKCSVTDTAVLELIIDLLSTN